MLIRMIKKKQITMDDLPTKVDMTNAIDNAVGKLAIMIQKGFTDVNGRINGSKEELGARITNLEKEMKGMHGNFDIIFQQFKEIREEMKEADTRADVVDLQVRVTKLEKKIKQ